MLTTSDYLTTRQAAEYLGLSIHTIYSLTFYRKIRFSKPNGKKIYFAKADLDAWLNRNCFPSNNEIDTKAATRLVTGGK